MATTLRLLLMMGFQESSVLAVEVAQHMQVVAVVVATMAAAVVQLLVVVAEVVTLTQF